VNKILPAILCLALFPLGAARAQDSMFLPSGKSQAVKALEAKQNARCLALYGPGYGALAGSDTCIKIGGRVRFEYGASSSKHNQLMIVPAPTLGAPGPAAAGSPVGVIRVPSTGSAARGDIYVDTRTQTELGDLRTHFKVGGVRASGALRGPDYSQ
jgi:hypothetical protein